MENDWELPRPECLTWRSNRVFVGHSKLLPLLLKNGLLSLAYNLWPYHYLC